MSIDATRSTWKLQHITAPQKILLLALADRADENCECWPSIPRLELDTCLDRKTIISNRQILIDKGLLKYTGELKGRQKQIPVMKLLYVNKREDEMGINNDDDFDSAILTSPKIGTSPKITIGTSPKNGIGTSPKNGTQNLKEEPTKKPNISCTQSRTFSSFESFWKLYPSKKAKKKCQEIWKRRKLDDIGDYIIEKLEHQLKNDKQYKDGIYIPNPSTYLNQDRWEDEVASAQETIKARQKLDDAKKQAELEKISQQRAEYEANKYNQQKEDAKIYRAIQKAALNGKSEFQPTKKLLDILKN